MTKRPTRPTTTVTAVIPEDAWMVNIGTGERTRPFAATDEAIAWPLRPRRQAGRWCWRTCEGDYAYSKTKPTPDEVCATADCPIHA